MKVLVDTSVWVSHFKKYNSDLSALLLSDRVVTHPLIVGELACGTPPEPRARTFADLKRLKCCPVASYEDTLYMIEHHKLYGRGCGWIDLSLLASTMITPEVALWTLDKRLNLLADHFNISYD